jgi:uncharacterized membrane-anchored protein YhcB (DUF1043 family)
MVWYVAIIAIVNLALGYMIAQYTNPRQPKKVAAYTSDDLLDEEAD